MPVYKAEGIVLRRHNLGEHDRVVVLLTRGHGKLRAAARGTRKITSRLAGRLEPFTEATFLLARGKTFDVVAQVEPAATHAALHRDLDRLTQAAYLVELVDRFLDEREPNEPVYLLLQEALDALERDDPAIVGLRFALQLAALAGYRPALDRCVVCEAAIEGPARFSVPLGGTLCGAHARRDPMATRLSEERRAALARLLARGALPALDEGTRAALSRLIQHYLEYRLEGRLRTPGVIEQIGSRAQAAPRRPPGAGVL